MPLKLSLLEKSLARRSLHNMLVGSLQSKVSVGAGVIRDGDGSNKRRRRVREQAEVIRRGQLRVVTVT